MDSRYTSTAGIGDLNQLSAAIPATRVEVSVSCRNLLDRDTFSKSDPITSSAEVTLLEVIREDWSQLLPNSC